MALKEMRFGIKIQAKCAGCQTKHLTKFFRWWCNHWDHGI